MPSAIAKTSPIKTEPEHLYTAEILETLLKIESGILRADSPRSIAEIALEHLERIIPSSMSTIMLFRSSYEEVVMLAGRQTRRKPGDTMPAAPTEVEARKRGEAQVIGDIAALSQKTIGLNSVLDLGGRSLLSVPLIVQGELLGTLTLIDASPNVYSEHHVQIARQVGNSVAVAIHNAHLLAKEIKARREAETLRKAAAFLNTSLDQDKLLDKILAQLELVLPFDRATIFLHHEDGGLAIANHRGRDLHMPELFPMIEEIPANILKIIAEKQPLIIPDTRSDPNWVVFPGGEFIHCWMGVPLLTKDSFIGMLMLDKQETYFYSEQDASLAMAFANHAAVAIENARLLEKERNARREAETLREVAGSMNASLEQEDFLSLVLDLLKRVLTYDFATILLLENDSLIPVAIQGITVPRKEINSKPEQLPPNLVRLSIDHQPQIIRDVREEPEWVTYPGTEFIRSWIGVPLLVKKEFIGLLMLAYAKPDFYKDHDAAVALAFANHAATSIENARLYREIRQYTAVLETRVAERTRELDALYKITAVMSQHLDLKATLDKIVAEISEALEIKTVSIQVIDQPHQILRLAAYKFLTPMMLDYLRERPITDPLVERILKRREATLYLDPSSEPELADMPVSKSSSYGVVSPIRAKGKNLGILAVAYYQEGEPTREDLALLTSIADHIGVAIENAHLRQQSEQLAVMQERERLARDLHDSATQSLFTLTLFAAAAREHLNNEQTESAAKQLVELEETAIQTHRDMRLLIYELRPTVLQEKGLEESLRQRIQMVELRSGIRGQVTVSLSVEIPFSIEQVLFHVANEALNNTLKHSGADTVMINIMSDDTQVTMRIKDNGQGFAMDNPDFTAGFGLGEYAPTGRRKSAVRSTRNLNQIPAQLS